MLSDSMLKTDDNTCFAIDISLLAVLVALHATKKNKNLELVVLALLFSHLIMTTDFFSKVGDEMEEVGAVRAVSVIDKARAANASLGSADASPKPNPQSVSDGDFDRMNTTQKPKSNADLARSRTSFYDNLLPK